MKRRCYGVYKNTKNKWLFNYISPIVKNLNKKHWGFDINDLEYIGYIQYYGSDKGQIDWHMDVGTSSIDNFTENKITCIVQLFDSEDYVGGSLQLFGLDGITKIPKAKGNTVIFPSYFMHRITPVTEVFDNLIK
jgi:PKHD-type hydroxylase